MTVVHEPDQQTMVLQVFVLVPLSAVRDGMLGQYRIGEYSQACCASNWC